MEIKQLNHFQFGNEMKLVDYLNIFCSFLSVFIIIYSLSNTILPIFSAVVDCLSGIGVLKLDTTNAKVSIFVPIVIRCSFITIYLLIVWIMNKSSYIPLILFIIVTILAPMLVDRMILNKIKNLPISFFYLSIFFVFLIVSIVFIIIKRKPFSYNIGILHFITIIVFLIFFVFAFATYASLHFEFLELVRTEKIKLPPKPPLESVEI